MGEPTTDISVHTWVYITGLKGISAVMIVVFNLQFIYSSPLDFVYKFLALMEFGSR